MEALTNRLLRYHAVKDSHRRHTPEFWVLTIDPGLRLADVTDPEGNRIQLSSHTA